MAPAALLVLSIARLSLPRVRTCLCTVAVYLALARSVLRGPAVTARVASRVAVVATAIALRSMIARARVATTCAVIALA